MPKRNECWLLGKLTNPLQTGLKESACQKILAAIWVVADEPKQIVQAAQQQIAGGRI